MYENRKILAVITARAGSKRLPNKNILNLAGKPLIAWTIEAAAESKYIDKLIVSTDSEEIKEVSLKYGAEVPFMRPAELATDTTDSMVVLNHAIDYFKEQFDYILLLQPTSPLRTVEDIDHAMEMLNENTLAVVSVCEMEHSPLWANILPENHSMEGFIRPEIKGLRSQDLPKFYRLNGALYISEMEEFFFNHGFFGKNTKAYIMPIERSVDIDNSLDMHFAEFLLQRKNHNG